MKDNQQSGLLQINDLLSNVPVTRRAVRVYEEQGLLLPSGRDSLGRRLFVSSALPRLRLICDLRGAGLALATIKDVLEARLIRRDDSVEGTWLDRLVNVMTRHTQELTDHMEAVTRAEKDMRQAIAWLVAHKQEVLASPAEAMADPQTPFIARALLIQPAEQPAWRGKLAPKAKAGDDPNPFWRSDEVRPPRRL